MRHRLALAIVVAACDRGTGGSIAIDSGPLVALVEGAGPRILQLDVSDPTITLAGGGTLPAWISASGNTIRLDPSCDVVSGTDSAPRLFSFEVSAGGVSTPLLVQVSASAAGICAPRLLACLPDPLVPCSTNPICDRAHAIAGDKLDVTVTGADRELVMSLDNPDAPDAPPLGVVPTTTAPLKLLSNADYTSYCAVLPDAHVVGNFNLSYTVVRGPDDTAPLVATGAYRFSWNIDDMYGIQIMSCASDGARSCTVLDNGACIRKDAAGDLVTVGVRVWISQKGAKAIGDGTTVPLAAMAQSGAPVHLATPTLRADGAVPLLITPLVLTEPFEIAADLGATTGDVAFTLGNSLTTTTVTVRTGSCP